jgi:hypothetical protein
LTAARTRIHTQQQRREAAPQQSTSARALVRTHQTWLAASHGTNKAYQLVADVGAGHVVLAGAAGVRVPALLMRG